MKNSIQIFVFIFVTISHFANAQLLNYKSYCDDLAIDESPDIVMLSDTSSIQVVNITGSNCTFDLFTVASYGKFDGTLVFEKNKNAHKIIRIGGSEDDKISDISISKNGSKLLIIGTSRSPVLSISVNYTTLMTINKPNPSIKNDDIFYMVYDLKNELIQRIDFFGSLYNETAVNCGFDSQNNLVLLYNYTYQTLLPNNTSIQTAVYGDNFMLLKLNPDGTVNQYVTEYLETHGDAFYMRSLHIDDQDNCYIAGEFRGLSPTFHDKKIILKLNY